MAICRGSNFVAGDAGCNSILRHSTDLGIACRKGTANFTRQIDSGNLPQSKSLPPVNKRRRTNLFRIVEEVHITTSRQRVDHGHRTMADSQMTENGAPQCLGLVQKTFAVDRRRWAHSRIQGAAAETTLKTEPGGSAI